MYDKRLRKPASFIPMPFDVYDDMWEEAGHDLLDTSTQHNVDVVLATNRTMVIVVTVWRSNNNSQEKMYNFVDPGKVNEI